MARRPPTEPPSEKEWTPESIRSAVQKIRRRLADVETFDPAQIERRDDPRITLLEAAIKETLAEIFGPNSRTFRSFSAAASLDTAGINMNGTPHHKVIDGLVHGKERSITLLNGAIRFFKEKMEDDFPGEPFDQVALEGRLDPVDYQDALANGVEALSAARVNVSVYNLPRCVLHRSVWPYAVQSISDWKNGYVEVCTPCMERSRCSGLFTSGRPRQSRGIATIL